MIQKNDRSQSNSERSSPRSPRAEVAAEGSNSFGANSDLSDVENGLECVDKPVVKKGLCQRMKEDIQQTFWQAEEDTKIFEDHISEERKTEIEVTKLKSVRLWILYLFTVFVMLSIGAVMPASNRYIFSTIIIILAILLVWSYIKNIRAIYLAINFLQILSFTALFMADSDIISNSKEVERDFLGFMVPILPMFTTFLCQINLF